MNHKFAVIVAAIVAVILLAVLRFWPEIRKLLSILIKLVVKT